MAAKKGKYIGFAKLDSKLAQEPGITNPGAVAASIGQKKYGNAGMAKMAAQGKAKAAIKASRKK